MNNQRRNSRIGVGYWLWTRAEVTNIRTCKLVLPLTVPLSWNPVLYLSLPGANFTEAIRTPSRNWLIPDNRAWLAYLFFRNSYFPYFPSFTLPATPNPPFPTYFEQYCYSDQFNQRKQGKLNFFQLLWVSCFLSLCGSFRADETNCINVLVYFLGISLKVYFSAEGRDRVGKFTESKLSVVVFIIEV